MVREFGDALHQLWLLVMVVVVVVSVLLVLLLLLLILSSSVCLQAGQKRKAEPTPDATKSKVKKK